MPGRRGKARQVKRKVKAIKQRTRKQNQMKEATVAAALARRKALNESSLLLAKENPAS